MVKKPWDYKWSSTRQHMMIETGSLIKDNYPREFIENWKDFLNTVSDDGDIRLLQLHERTGRPLGDRMFIEKLESLLNITLKKKKAGRPKKDK